MTTIYWTDDQLNRWTEADGVTSYGPPGGPDSGGQTALAVAVLVPGSGIFAFGVTDLDGVTGWGAIGWHTGDDLTEIDGLWLPLDTVGQWTVDGDELYQPGTAYDSSGATWDPVTGRIFLTGIFRRYDPVLDVQVEHNMAIIDPAAEEIDDTTILSTSPSPTEGFYYVYEPSGVFNAGGQCVIGRKLYYSVDNGGQGIVEFDMDTFETRIAEYCFDHQRTGDLCVRPGDSTGLWVIDRSPFVDNKIYLNRYEIGDIPWFTSYALNHVAAVPSESILLFDENEPTPVISECEAMGFISADEIVYWGYDSDVGQPGWWRQVIDPPGEPTLIVDLGPDWFDNHSAAYQMYVVPEAPAVLTGTLRGSRVSFDL